MTTQEPSSWRISRLRTSSRGLEIALELDAPHVDPLARVDEEGDVHLSLVLADLRYRIDVCKRVALVAETGLDLRGRTRDVASIEDVPLAHVHQGKEVVGLDHQITGELDRADLEGLSFDDVES